MFPCFSKRITSDSIDQQWHELRRDDTATDAAADFTSLSISKYLSKWRPNVSPQRGEKTSKGDRVSHLFKSQICFLVFRENPLTQSFTFRWDTIFSQKIFKLQVDLTIKSVNDCSVFTW